VVTGSTIVLTSPTPPTLVTLSTQSPTACGLQDGVIQVLANSTIGGALEYSKDSGVSWQSSNTFFNLGGGVFDLCVRNFGSNCTVTVGQVSLTNPSFPQIDTVNITSVSGCIGSNGVIEILMQGVANDLEYSINGFNWKSSPIFTGLSNGNYTVVVRKNNGTCQTAYAHNPVLVGATNTETDTTFITEYTCHTNTAGTFVNIQQGNDGCDSLIIKTVIFNAPTVSLVKATDVTDCGLSDGSIILQGTGGSGTYEYSIDSGLTFHAQAAFSNLAAGVYYPFIRNNDSSCVIGGFPILIEAPNAASISSLNVVDITDCGKNDGVISIFTSSSMTLQYSIDSGVVWQSANTFTNLSLGTYHIFVKNNNGTCLVGDSIAVINEPLEITIDSILTTNITNCSSADGTIKIFATGLNFEYTVNGGLTWSANNVFTNLPIGSYNLAVRRNDGTCLVSYANNPVNLTSPSAPIITDIFKTHPSDCGIADGSLEMILTGGIGTYLYSIDNGQTFHPNNIFTGLPGGSYLLFVANSDTTCIIQGLTQVLIDKVPPTIVSPPITSPISNCGLQDATIQINASGNGLGLIYSIDSGSTWSASSLFINLGANVYKIMAANPDTTCVTYIGTETVVNQASPTINGIIITDVTNCTQPNGILQIAATGNPALTLEYSINGGATYQTSNVFNNLAPGNYYVAIRYMNGGCEVIDPTIYSIGALNGPDIVDIDHTDPTGCGLNNGTITITTNGGIAPTIFSINNGSTWTTNNHFNNLPSGTYVIWVSNADTTCSISTIPIVIDSLPTVVIDSISFTMPTNCAKGDGTITIHANSSSSTVILEYSSDGGQTWQSNKTIGSLYKGTYDLVVRSGVGCETTFVDYVLNATNNDLIDTVESISPSSCNTSDGVIVVYPHFDLFNLAYSLDSVTWKLSNVFNNMNGGEYNVYVRSLKTEGCIDMETLIISSPDSGTVADGDIVIGDVSCYGGSDGFFEVTLTLSSGPQLSALYNQPAGIYEPEVRDPFGCGRTVTLTINEPDPLDLILIPSPIQDNQETGGIQIVASGGVPPYVYSYSKEGVFDNLPVTNLFIGDLEKGRYMVSLTDSNGCKISSIVELKDNSLEVFNTITPNGDNANDYLTFDRITNNICTKTNELMVFNRWGQVVFFATDYANDWEGTDLSGEKLPSGAYFYIFKCYRDGVEEPIEERRSLTILRND
jgi:gliding motility-associated-like protein